MRQARDVAEEIYQLAQEGNVIFRSKHNDKSSKVIGPSADPNQDELWEEFWRNCVESDRGQEYFDIEEAKKRYRITRVK